MLTRPGVTTRAAEARPLVRLRLGAGARPAATKPSSTRIQPSACSVPSSSIVSDVRVGEQGLHACVPYLCPRGRDHPPLARRGAAAEVRAPRRARRSRAAPTCWSSSTSTARGPEAILNLDEVAGAARAGRARTARSARRRPHLHRGDARRAGASCCPRSPRRRARSARRRSATAARSAATSAPPRPPATRTRRCSSRTPTVELAQRPRRAHARRSRVPPRPEAERARAGRARRSRSASSRAAQPQTFMKVGPRNAMVIAVCSLAVLVDRERGELRAAYGSAGPVARARHRAARRRATLPRARRGRREPDRRRPRHRRLPPARAARAHAPRARRVPRMKIAADASTASAREADVLGGREPALRRCASSSSCPARRTRASRASAARARCCSTATLVCACLVLAAQADGHEVTTVEGLARRRAACTACSRRSSRRAPCSAASARRGSSSPPPTCSSAYPSPSDDEIREALSGNLCRCTGYAKIFDAVRLAARAHDARRQQRRAQLQRGTRRRARRRAHDAPPKVTGEFAYSSDLHRGRDALGPHAPQPARARADRRARHLARR